MHFNEQLVKVFGRLLASVHSDLSYWLDRRLNSQTKLYSIRRLSSIEYLSRMEFQFFNLLMAILFLYLLLSLVSIHQQFQLYRITERESEWLGCMLYRRLRFSDLKEEEKSSLESLSGSEGYFSVWRHHYEDSRQLMASLKSFTPADVCWGINFGLTLTFKGPLDFRSDLSSCLLAW